MSHRHCEDNILILFIYFIYVSQTARLPGLFPP